MIKWAALKFPPINLLSYPRQNIDFMRSVVNELDCINTNKMRDLMELEENLENYEIAEVIARKILKEKEFIYYCHAGRFPE